MCKLNGEVFIKTSSCLHPSLETAHNSTCKLQRNHSNTKHPSTVEYMKPYLSDDGVLVGPGRTPFNFPNTPSEFAPRAGVWWNESASGQLDAGAAVCADVPLPDWVREGDAEKRKREGGMERRRGDRDAICAWCWGFEEESRGALEEGQMDGINKYLYKLYMSSIITHSINNYTYIYIHTHNHWPLY